MLLAGAPPAGRVQLHGFRAALQTVCCAAPRKKTKKKKKQFHPFQTNQYEMDTTFSVEANEGWSPAPVNAILVLIPQERIAEGCTWV